MIRKITGMSLLATAMLSLFPLACQPGGVGDPCTPEDEYNPEFSGYNVGESTAEARSFQCETRLCLVDHFRGRVSCKYGQAAPAAGADPSTANCKVPGDPDKAINKKVDAQYLERQADKAVYCSCRCDGADKNARYCKCPSGFACKDSIPNLGIGDAQLAGSYCIRNGSEYDASNAPTTTCTAPNCGANEG